MTTNKVSDLVSTSDGESLNQFFITQLLTNGQKTVVLLEDINKKLWVLIKKTEEGLAPQVQDEE